MLRVVLQFSSLISIHHLDVMVIGIKGIKGIKIKINLLYIHNSCKPENLKYN